MMLTDLSFLDEGKPWPPIGEAERIARMTANIDIFNGGRGSFLVMKNWMDKDVEVRPKKLHIKVPLPEKATGVVLNGALPELELSVASEAMNARFQAWMARDRFPLTLEEAAVDWCRCGVGVLKVSRSGEAVKIRAVRPDCWIPVCWPDDDREFRYHVLFTQWTEKSDSGSESAWMKIEIHSEMTIEYRLYQISEAGKLVRRDLAAKANLFEGYDLDGNDSQPVPGWCVFPVWNSRTTDQAYGIPDASFSPEALSIVEALEMALSQRRYNHSGHSKPVTVVSKGSIKSDPYTDRTKTDLEKPLLVWGDETDASRAVAFIAAPLDSSPHISQEITDLLIAFVNVTELSAAMVSGVDSANVASGRALMLELTPTMDHLRRFRAAFWDVIPAVLEAAGRLATPASGLPPIAAEDIRMNWELSLATDPTETAQRLEILCRAGIYSPQQAHRELGLSQEDSDRIMDEIEANATAKAPSGPELEPLALEIPPGEVS